MTDSIQVSSPNAIVMPAVSTAQMLQAQKEYEDLKKALIDRKNDIQIIQGRDHLKKSYWRKLATAFNLSTEVVKEEFEQVGKTYVYNFTVKAIAPNGRFSYGVGSCDAYEKAFLIDGEYMTFRTMWNQDKKKYVKVYDNDGKPLYDPAIPNSLHNVRSTAMTRAINRAISDLVGGGEVTADEIVDHGDIDVQDEVKKEPVKVISMVNEYQITKLKEIMQRKNISEAELLKGVGKKSIFDLTRKEAGDIIVS